MSKISKEDSIQKLTDSTILQQGTKYEKLLKIVIRRIKENENGSVQRRNGTKKKKLTD